jgi:hypothetical protein
VNVDACDIMFGLCVSAFGLCGTAMLRSIPIWIQNCWKKYVDWCLCACTISFRNPNPGPNPNYSILCVYVYMGCTQVAELKQELAHLEKVRLDAWDAQVDPTVQTLRKGKDELIKQLKAKDQALKRMSMELAQHVKSEARRQRVGRLKKTKAGLEMVLTSNNTTTTTDGLIEDGNRAVTSRDDDGANARFGTEVATSTSSQLDHHKQMHQRQSRTSFHHGSASISPAHSEPPIFDTGPDTGTLLVSQAETVQSDFGEQKIGSHSQKQQQPRQHHEQQQQQQQHQLLLQSKNTNRPNQTRLHRSVPFSGPSSRDDDDEVEDMMHHTILNNDGGRTFQRQFMASNNNGQNHNNNLFTATTPMNTAATATSGATRTRNHTHRTHDIDDDISVPSCLSELRGVAVVEERACAGGKTLRVLSNGVRRLLYRNGTERFLFGDGRATIIFSNGDYKHTDPRNTTTRSGKQEGGVEEYFYAQDRTKHITYLATGLEIVQFANGQVERRSPDGRVEVMYPDGTCATVINKAN